MHIGSSWQLAITALDAPIDVMITLQPMNIVQAAADLMFSPVISKFPDVTIALSEGGIGWIPYFLERIDHIYKEHKAWTFAGLRRQAAERGVHGAHDPLLHRRRRRASRNRHQLDIDHITWECDYPHSDSTWPHAPELLVRSLDGPPRRRDQQDHPPEHDAALPVRPVHATSRASSAPSARCAPRPNDVDVLRAGGHGRGAA